MGSASNPDQFNIRWKNYTLVLQSVFRELLEDERLVDVTLSCEGGSIKCHRIMLTACSSYFEKLLAQYPLQSHLVIFLKDIRHWELQALVYFMYNGEVSVKQNRLAPLVRAAESLHIRGLSSDSCDRDEEADKLGEEYDIGDEEQAYHRPSSAPRKSNLGQGNSLLRNINSAMGRDAYNKVTHPIKRLSQSNGPPKLLKMQKLDKEPATVGSLKVPNASTSTSRLSVDKKVSSTSLKKETLENTGEGEMEDGNENGELEMNIQENEEEIEGEGSSSDLDDEEGSLAPPGERKVYKYDKELKDSALTALNSGLTLRQCSEAFGIPRKTLSKWRCQSVAELAEPIDDGVTDEQIETQSQSIPPVICDPPMMGPVVDAADRADRLVKATDLALSGITVRQAAAHYGIPRTTLCAYMKRRGLTGKRLFTSNSNAGVTNSGGAHVVSRKPQKIFNQVSSSNQKNQEDGFPFMGLAALVDGMEVYEDEYESQLPEYDEDPDASPVDEGQT